MFQRLMAYARLFFLGAHLSFIALFSWLTPQAYFAMKVLGPVMTMLFFVLLGRYVAGNDDASFYVVGNALHAATLSGIYGVVMSIDGDRQNGTLIYLFGTPANRLLLFLGRAFMHVLDGSLGVAAGLLWGVLIFGLDLSAANLPALLPVIVVATLSTSGLGLVLGCLGLVTRNVLFIGNLVFALLWIFSGANVPIETLPSWAQAVAYAVPLTRSIAAARSVVAGAGLSEVMPLVWGDLLVGLIYALVGFAMFRRFEVQARRRGTLEAF
jgi:ABC-2 type transport system permease protein